MADALDLMIRLPQLWRRVEALEVKASYARFVARRTRDLSAEQASYVDERAAEPADGRIPWSRFEDLVTGLVVASDPEARRRRSATTPSVRSPTPLVPPRTGCVASSSARRSRSSPSSTRASSGSPTSSPALGDTDDRDRRRVKAIAILANPHAAVALIEAFVRWRDRPECPADGHEPRTGEKPELDWATVMPSVILHVHTYAGSEPTGTARAEGHGPVTEEWVRDHLGPHARFTIRPVLDLEGQAPVDAYEIPDRHRQAVHLMTPADTFPWGVSTSRAQQIDHTEPYRSGGPPGQSRVGNYGPMTTFHHRIKTHGAWEVRQPFPGIYVWRDPHGATYVVDHSGTRRLADVGRTDRRSPAEARLEQALFSLAA